MILTLLSKKISLANLPTRITKLQKLSELIENNIFLKHDDETGFLLSGNKIRKLEYLLYDAQEKGCDTIITCGGIQSNHARATAVASIQTGFKPIVLLIGKEPEEYSGNLFIDKIVGAKTLFYKINEYFQIEEKFTEIAEQERQAGRRPYVIPMGGSNEIGILGYINAMSEINDYMNHNNIKFDTIVCPTGTGGTHAGLLIGKKLLELDLNIVSFNVLETAEFLTEHISQIISKTIESSGFPVSISKEEINVIDGYVGEGYAETTEEEISEIISLARTEGIAFDHTYTGKAFIGLKDQLEKSNSLLKGNILFIHTGGTFGLFSETSFISKFL